MICPNCNRGDWEVVIWFERKDIVRVQHWVGSSQKQEKICDLPLVVRPIYDLPYGSQPRVSAEGKLL